MRFNIFPWRSLKTRVTLLTLATFVIGIWSLTLYVGHTLRQDMQRSLGEQQFSTASIVAAQINEELIDRFGGLDDIAAEVTPATMANPASLQPLLERHRFVESLFSGGILAFNRDGIAVGDVPRSAQRIGINYGEDEWILAALKQGKSTVGKLIMGKVLHSPVFTLTVPIRDLQGQVIGALSGVVNLGQPNFLDKITQGRYGDSGGYVLVAPQQRLIITATDKSRIMQSLAPPGVIPQTDRFIQGLEGYAVYVNPLGEEVLNASKRIPVAGWNLVVTMPTAEAFAPIRALQQHMQLATIVLTLLAGTLMWWLVRRQLWPLSTTVKTLASMSASNQLLKPLPVIEQDEVGELIGGFNHLLLELRQREKTLQESESKFRATFEEAAVGISHVALDGRWLRVNQKLCDITGYTREELLTRRYQDITHPDDLENNQKLEHHLLTEEVPTYSIEKRYLHKSGRLVWVRPTVSVVNNDSGEPDYFISVIQDITEHKLAESHIQALAFSDPLTGLPNRRLLMDRLEQALAATARHGHQDALLFIDLDDFKTLNDTLGHDKGDRLLKEIAKRLLACVREGDTVARLSGDEFVVLLEDLSKDAPDAATQAETVGRKILDALGKPHQLDGHGHHSSASIGITLFGGAHRESVEEPLKRAELAMYQAKAAGRNTLRFFEPEMYTAVLSRANMEADLRQALAQGQFLLHYQPQCADSVRLIGAEALVRWQHPQRGLVSPAEFIPIAEASGLILHLGQWVLRTACAQLALWASRAEMAPLSIAVNVSARELRQPNFVDQVLSILQESGANPARLKLELTESILVDNVEDTIAKMRTLKGSGVSFSLDDFGTGYSSLSYLKRLPLDQLKIDRSFVENIFTDRDDAAIAKMVVALAQSLELEVVAEGVETEAQWDFLAAVGCRNYQGYLFSRPLPIEEFEVFAAKVSLGSNS